MSGRTQGIAVGDNRGSSVVVARRLSNVSKNPVSIVLVELTGFLVAGEPTILVEPHLLLLS